MSQTLYRLVFCCNCKMDLSLQSLITPLQLEHLGLLAVTDATFPVMSAPRALQDALSRLPQPLIVPENLLRSILATVRQRAHHPELVIYPSVECCSRCGSGVHSTEFRKCKALTFVDGVVPVSFGVSRCSCGASFTGSWMSPNRCFAKVLPASDPNKADYFQIVALPKAQSVAFIETRLLMFITCGVTCCALSFTGVVQTFEEFHVTPMPHM